MLNSSNIHIMCNSLLKVSKLLRRDFNEIEKLQNSKQGTHKFANNSLINVKESIYQDLSKARPDGNIRFIENENNQNNFKKNYEFIVNPISGINNYKNGISYFALSIALIIENETAAAVIYDPIRDEMFCAEKGKGAFINNLRMRVSTIKNTEHAYFVLKDHSLLNELIKIKLELSIIKNIRVFGSCCLDLANLASGKIDCYVTQNIKDDKYTAGKLFIRESGGIDISIESPGLDIITNNNLSENFKN